MSFEFADTLDKMLCDRLVWGIADSHIQHQLLAGGSFPFPKALKIVQAVEMATHDLKDLHTETSSTPVNKLQRHTTPSTPAAKSHTPCYCCGRKHTAAQCQFKTEWCRGCNKVGHIVKMCCRKRRDQPEGKGQPTHKVEGLPPSREYTIYPVLEQQSPSTPLKTTVVLEGRSSTWK